MIVERCDHAHKYGQDCQASNEQNQLKHSCSSWKEVHTTYCKEQNAIQFKYHERLFISSRGLYAAILKTCLSIEHERCRLQKFLKLPQKMDVVEYMIASETITAWKCKLHEKIKNIS